MLHRHVIPSLVLSALMIPVHESDAQVYRTETGSIVPDVASIDRALGGSFAADEESVVLGLKDESDPSDGGSLVFMRNIGGTWSQVGSYGGPSNGDYFLGARSALDGGVAVAARSFELGADEVLLFAFNDGSGSWESRGFIPEPPGTSDSFGASLAVNGQIIAIGDPGAKRVWIYKYTNEEALLLQELESPAAGPVAFGSALDLSDDMLVVGDPYDDTGRVDLFEYLGGAYVHAMEVDPQWAPVDSGDEYGSVVSIDGNTLAIGAPKAGNNQGGLVVFCNGPDFNVTAYLPINSQDFGLPTSLDTQDGSILVGATGTDPQYPGFAAIYRWSGSSWQTGETLALETIESGAWFGACVALTETEAIVGAPYEYHIEGGSPVYTGAIGLFSQDCDGDGISNHVEIANGTTSDYNGNGLPDDCEHGDYVVVPRDHPTVQDAVDAAQGTTILVAAGNYDEAVVIDGVDTDIRALDPSNPPVFDRFDFSAPAMRVTSALLSLHNIAFDSNVTSIDASQGARLELNDCSFTFSMSAVRLLDSPITVAFDCLFQGNTGLGGGGAAIYSVDSSIELTDCTFQENGGNSSPVVSTHYGGAIYMAGNLSSDILATDCVFDRNIAMVDHEIIAGQSDGSARGGAFYASNLTGESRFQGCVFMDNEVRARLQKNSSGNSPGNNIAWGAGVAVNNFNGLLVFEDCTFQGNVTQALDAGGFYGLYAPAAYIDGFPGSTVAFNGCVIDGERLYKETLAGEITIPPLRLAAVELTSINVASVTYCEFNDLPNGALGYTGPNHVGEFSGAGCTFTDAAYVGVSGAFEPFFTTSNFVGTRLSLDGDITSCNFDAVGPMEDESFETFVFYGTADSLITNCTFHRCYTDYIIGGGTAQYPVKLTATTICGNEAQPFNSDVYWTSMGGNTIEGGPSGTMDCGGPVDRAVPSQYQTIVSAVAAARNGDTIVLASGTYEETVDLRGFGSINLSGAPGASTVISPPAGSPGIRINGGSVSIVDVAISDATIGIDAQRGDISLDNLVIEDCSSDCGGAIRLGDGHGFVEGDGASCMITNSHLRYNSSSGDGGAICVEAEAMLGMDTCTVEGNTAENDGGGIFVADKAASIQMIGCDMLSNDAINDGGGIRCRDAGITELTFVQFQGNSAGRFGGGAAIDSVEFDDCTFSANTAGVVGGGARSVGTSVFADCQFHANTAQVAGGLAATAVETYVENFISCGNVGGDYYGNILTQDGALLYCSDDCNANGIPDQDEIASGDLDDCNGNMIPDICEDLSDVDGNGIPDACDPAAGRMVLLAERDVVESLPLGAVDLLARPLFRNGSRTHDALVLLPDGDGYLLVIGSNEQGDYMVDQVLVGASFERCCTGGFYTVCINNGPAGGSSLAFARGDFLITHPDGNMGLFDEEFEMYYACDAPAGAGLPEAITDYQLAPDSDSVMTVEYIEEVDGLAKVAVPLTGQVLVAKGKEGPQEIPISGRHGSGQGGTGPYPGVDKVDVFPESIVGITAGDFNGDGNEDLVVLHPDEMQISIRNFTGLADYIDQQTGILVPSGATWSAPTYINLSSAPIDAVAGQFVELPGSADDGLDDLFLIREYEGGIVGALYAATAPNTLGLYGTQYVFPVDEAVISKSSTGQTDSEVALIAGQSNNTGIAVLWALWQDPDSNSNPFTSIYLGNTKPLRISATQERFGASPSRIVSVLTEDEIESRVHFIDIGERPPMVVENDECDSPIELFEGANPFDTAGATDSDAPLEVACQSDGQIQPHADIWFSWVAPASGVAMASTCGAADFDTWLVAYEGNCEGSVVGCNDEDILCSSFTSRMTFDVIEGTTYLIRVGSWSAGQTGSGTLTVIVPNLPADLNGDGFVNGADLAMLLGYWGQPGSTDLNGDGTTGGADLTILLASWTT